MKSIMLSIRPEWLQKILSGQKTVELRLSRPNLTPPFMVFLYCSCKGTKKPGEILEIHSGGKIYKANGLVVGEFTCTEIDRVVRVGYMGSNAPLQYCVNAHVILFRGDDFYVFRTVAQCVKTQKFRDLLFVDGCSNFLV